jgi:hypothetical protein
MRRLWVEEGKRREREEEKRTWEEVDGPRQISTVAPLIKDAQRSRPNAENWLGSRCAKNQSLAGLDLTEGDGSAHLSVDFLLIAEERGVLRWGAGENRKREKVLGRVRMVERLGRMARTGQRAASLKNGAFTTRQVARSAGPAITQPKTGPGKPFKASPLFQKPRTA